MNKLAHLTSMKKNLWMKAVKRGKEVMDELGKSQKGSLIFHIVILIDRKHNC